MFGNKSYLTAILTAAAITSHVLGSLHLLCTCHHGPFFDEDVFVQFGDFGMERTDALASTTDDDELCECQCRGHLTPVVSERVLDDRSLQAVDSTAHHASAAFAVAATSLDVRPADRPQPHPPPQPLHVLLCALRI